MTILNKTLIALSVPLFAINAHSAVSYGSSSAGQVYVGAKLGLLDADIADKKNTAYGIYGGYNFDQTVGVEAEYITTSTKQFDVGSERHEYDAKSMGVYGTYRYHMPNTAVYLKGKLGMANTEVDSKGLTVNSSHTADKTSVAGGVGVGFKANQNVGVEAGFNYLNADAQLWSVGAYFAF
ncbi:outer membrane beta-barrel protein [Moraxella oblonga]|uniref:outer membrane beta-barrel protein n=1 Tax=Moraxella oblonga TaxID=200413 RepID=UPI00082D0251|nr:outer membrane beta-barrel protein [Moraxella oblonga]